MHCLHTSTSAGYLLGALDPAERAEFHRHATDCDQCGREIDELLPVVILLWRTRAYLGGPTEDERR